MTKITTLKDLLEPHPIIAAVRDEKSLNNALKTPVRAIFILNTILSDLKKRVVQVRDQGKLVFIHVEMVAGLSKDHAALEYLRSEIAPDGIITTKPNLVQPSRDLGFITVQRLFILDSQSVHTGLKMLQGNHPDFLEVMPGIIAKVIPEIKNRSQIPVIAGGMVSTKEEIINMLKVGVVAVSTSCEDLWSL